MSPALYVFDADGTLRLTTVQGQFFPIHPGEWKLRPGVVQKLATIDWGHVGFGVASNQSGVGRGLLSGRMATVMLANMAREATGRPWPADVLLHCPHLPTESCACRKPQPGMLVQLMRRYEVPPERTLFVGNADTDRLAAQRVGCTFAWENDFFPRE